MAKERKSVAVVGSGLAGLTAAWLLGSRYRVDIYERQPALGMDAHSTSLRDGDSETRVDVPLRVMTGGYYPNLMSMYKALNVRLAGVDYSQSYTVQAGRTVFRYINFLLFGLSVPLVNWRSLASLSFLRTTWELVYFLLVAGRHMRAGQLDGKTIKQYVTEQRYSDAFVHAFLLPAMCVVCTCSYEAVSAYPAAVIVEYLTTGLTLMGVKRAMDGTRSIVSKLSSRADNVFCGSPVQSVSPQPDGTSIVKREGADGVRYDAVVFATEASVALKLLGDAASKLERQLLGAVPYESSCVIVHTDERLMPPHRAHWSPVNVLLAPGDAAPMASIWMNRVQPMAADPPVFQTWNPTMEPAADSVRARGEFTRPVVSLASAAAVARMSELQGQRNLYFCGAYALPGVPLLENAVCSSIAVAKLLGVSCPWPTGLSKGYSRGSTQRLVALGLTVALLLAACILLLR